ncbi:MAG TPA: 3-phosphoshikimate 1-carboxyvinyltransferase, partial [Gammaproteobacteria bacterium]|nr:3-phosphoshikimate 1-carboxyvinyltransferase [Gammaproteobacteria bacterium]
NIFLPSSKSETIRALFFSLLAKGESRIQHFLASEDTDDAIRVCQSLGADCQQNNKNLMITSEGIASDIPTHLYTGNSGITSHFVLPILGLRKNHHDEVTVDCGKLMRRRPIHLFGNALKQLGLKIHYLEKEGFFPLKISGCLMGGNAYLDGVTSQYLSALLIALPCAARDSIVTVKNLHERPYVNMTLRWLQEQNIPYTHQHIEQEDIYHIQGQSSFKNFQKKMPGDFSSASYFIAAGLFLDGKIELQGLDMRDAQGDKQLISLMRAAGANIQIFPSRIVIQGGSPLKGIDIDAKDIPDLVPTLAVIGTQMQNRMKIYNVPNARLKETDRIHSMTQGLKRLGARIEEFEDGMTVYPTQLIGSKLQGFHDHRTVMALSIAGMLAEGETIIEDAEAIHKTFPDFVKLMQQLGASIVLAD